MISVDNWSNFHHKYCSEDHRRSFKAQKVIEDDRGIIGKIMRRWSRGDDHFNISQKMSQKMRILKDWEGHRLHQSHCLHHYWREEGHLIFHPAQTFKNWNSKQGASRLPKQQTNYEPRQFSLWFLYRYSHTKMGKQFLFCSIPSRIMLFANFTFMNLGTILLNFT